MTLPASTSAAPIAEEYTWRLPHRELTLGSRPLIMGIVNVTPDSFSDGNLFASPEQAVDHALQLAGEGAQILDVGGESTRPGAAAVPFDEELRRVEPVVKKLAQQSSVPISVDTSKAKVAEICLDVGAEIINDVTALTGDPRMAEVVREANAGVILMHMQGDPRTMQKDPQYREVVADIIECFQQRLDALQALGLDAARLAIDPGIGFGKTMEHNVEILARLGEFRALRRPLCLGVSRKRFIGKLLDRSTEQRLFGSLAVACHAMSQQAVHILRVHDVGPTRDVVNMWAALSRRRSKGD